MPTYAYRCTACEHAFEVQQSFTDDALTVCPACEGRLRKVFSAVGVVFKGSGFYRNDARSGGKTTSRTPSSTSGASTSTSTTSDSGTSTSTSTSSSTSGTATATKATTAAPAAGA